MNLNALIIDDESKSRNALRAMLDEYCPQIVVVGEASTPIEAVKEINSKKPELVFMDVEMPGGTGFDVLEAIAEPTFATIFVTAYDKYAVKAFRHSAFDYLLKPLNIEELESAVNRAVQAKLSDRSVAYEVLKANREDNTFTKIAIPSGSTYQFAEIGDIIRCEADGSYTTIFMMNGDQHVASKKLKDFEQTLEEHNFCRVHHSHLINLDHIVSYQRGKGGHVLMKDGAEVQISTRRREAFLKLVMR